MNFADDEPNAILSKSLILASKTVNRLNQIDQYHFPTDSSNDARQLLIDSFIQLQKPENVIAMDPSVLYNRLIALQELCDLIVQSSVDSISWPLVGYCDDIWKSFFDTNNHKIFYSVTPEHNYSIFNFSAYVASLLDCLLSPTIIKELIKKEIHCLQLASIEDDNLPLYAIIGHEFGHTVFDRRKSEIFPILGNHFIEVINQINKHFIDNEKSQAERRLRRTIEVVKAMAEELFSDLVGSLLMGPAYFLSSFEMSWGYTGSTFRILLAPEAINIRAYPSDLFRLNCTKTWTKVEDFCKSADIDFNKLKCSELKQLSKCLSTIPTTNDSDCASVRPKSDIDAAIIRDAIELQITQIKSSFNNFLADAAAQLRSWYPSSIVSLSTNDIGELLLRLQHNILPNIIPDGTLRGKPANLASILNASALLRLQLLATGDSKDQESLARRIGRIERLTAKALEVSFIQDRYNQWAKD
ncbi:MAG: hypothetical protein GY865_09535 [candidate division Zixibacteria bacterium]|nr:hypothetical protein [candidate division Zixibacteria bacterium]